MNRAVSRSCAAVLLAALALVVSSASVPPAAPLHPETLVILSAGDLKGKIVPCGCHVPKGGVARRAFYVDSLERIYGQVLHIDNGGFLPDEDSRRETAEFLMDAFQGLKLDALNVGELDLRYGLAFLRQGVRARGLPIVSANLLDRRTRRPVFSPYRIKRVGGVTVGVIGLINSDANLGPARDSIVVGDPEAAARGAIRELRQQGADVIVLLSQLGQRNGELLVQAVDGIDAVMLGHNTVVQADGKTLKHTTACYGGEQGHYLCRADIQLDARHHASAAESHAVMLGSELRSEPVLEAKAKALEDDLKLRADRAFQEQQLAMRPNVFENSAEHFIGAELCIRCHEPEGEAWKTTSHSQAWTTLVNVRRDSVVACIGCHVAGFMKTGGFVTAASTPGLENVQCESCHGIGTDHDAFAGRRHLDASACTSCHGKQFDPEFDFDKALPKVLHSNHSGETIQRKRVRQPGDEKNVPGMMKMQGS